MLLGECLTVRYITVNNCFAYLPDALLRELDSEQNVVEVVRNKSTYFLSCDPRPNCDRALYLSGTFARSLGLSEGDEVFVSSVKGVPSVSSITVTPSSQHDRDILEIQIDRIQSSLLNQIRVVAANQPIVAWISKFSSVTLITESLKPDYRYGKLEQFTEVHVSDVVKDATKSNSETERGGNSNFPLQSILGRILPDFRNNRDAPKEDRAAKNYALLQSFRCKSKPRVCRVHFLPKFDSPNESEVFEATVRSPYHVLMSRSHLPEHARFTKGAVLCRFRKIAENHESVVTSATRTNFLRERDASFPKLPSELTVKLYVLEDVSEKRAVSGEEFHDPNFVHPAVYVSDSVKASLKLKAGSKVSVEPIDSADEETPSSIEIFPLDESATAEKFKDHVKSYSKRDKLLLNSCAILVFDDASRCFVRFSPSSCKYTALDENVLKNCTVYEKPIPSSIDATRFESAADEEIELDKISTRHLQDVLSDCWLTLNLCLGMRVPRSFEYDRENILICGEMGSGKTTICKILIRDLRKPPCFVHTHFIECRSLKGKKAEMLQKVITMAMSECIYYQPSVLFLDDLESITSASSNAEETTPDSMNASRITDMLANAVTRVQESHYVSVIATCAGASKIGQKLRPAKGNHFFGTVLSVPNLEKADRVDILQLTLRDKLHVPGDVNWDYCGNKTEGWMVQDLVDVAEKATFAAWKRHTLENARPPIVVTDEDVSSTLKSYTPLSLHDVQLYKGSGHSWSDIGGLSDVKRSLTEILHWPLKYPEIFKNAPIKLQNGVLLYGMPGTGKTMLAKAIADECGVNLISVKGPELLSKYIGVSEESVRKVFERALRAKPCVLFFDEFDSLAPRRGHDSTGVTDRVVNQLLTQLDGVEDREGVAVVAASSRPDLLDPALLRPGRLDKALHCPLPNETERQEILAALCKLKKIDTNRLNLKELALQSSGFTGADLSGVITQAGLFAFEDALLAARDGNVVAEDITVTQTNLLESVGLTQPSLSAAEKSKYDRIYERFSGGGNVAEDVSKNQKATLA